MASEKPKLPAGRITIGDRLYHQTTGDQAVVAGTSLSVMVESDEQVFHRRTQVSESTEALGLGWFAEKPEQISYVRIANEEGNFLQVNPTDEEREATAAKVLILSVSGVPFCRVIPGDSIRLNPIDASKLAIQSASGVTRFSIHVYPA